MALFLCSICHDQYRAERLRCLPCGHTFCAACIKSFVEINARAENNRRRAASKFACPSCREPFREKDPHPVYLDTEDPNSPEDESAPQQCHPDAVHRRVEVALREVKRVEDDLRHQTVQRAAQEIEKVAELSGDGPECMLGLLAAVAGRWRGMLSLFTTIAEERNEVIRLKAQLRETEAARDAAVGATSRVEQATARVLETAEKAHQALATAREETRTKQKLIEQMELAHQEVLKEKDEKISSFFDRLNALKKREGEQKREIEKLRAEARSNADRIRDLTASQPAFLDIDESGPSSSKAGPSSERMDIVLEDSQATFERIPTSSHKRRGSEDDLVVLDPGMPSQYDSPPPSPIPERPEPSARTTAPRPPVFNTDWNFSRPKNNGKAKVPAPPNPSCPIALDRRGKPLKPVQSGSRKRLRHGDS
ncbi:hypothetical protein C8Q79DRAFT_264345 [Trametes meyenii]|nr:hypothetical protein C8Q79DRAFT_264345 [Trametes meyenii]